MSSFFKDVYYSFPVQLFILHFRKFQVLLLFWYILFSTISGNFMKIYGADALFLAPEYLGKVNAGGAAIVGVAAGVFIMSWNITTFILHSRRYRFLATATKPFLKYCLNNSILPLAFLLYYFIQAMHFDTRKELIPGSEFLLIAAGFFGGFFFTDSIFIRLFFYCREKDSTHTYPRN